ncbi:hypothetical protein [Haloterrigena salifodinae]|uniref:hypothetical protein n=1 Tax=Haloterrigena salifodinae TaxID=2675099 RepID=UPI001E347261|nr:hypothetical protein [Haloterrigena salifodinae]
MGVARRDRYAIAGLFSLVVFVACAETVKTLSMQYELAHLSKVLLVVGFPTLLGYGIFTMTYSTIIETVGTASVLVLAVSGVVTFVFLPFIVLLVYTFRIVSIASRTADFDPSVPRVDFDEAGLEEGRE